MTRTEAIELANEVLRCIDECEDMSLHPAPSTAKLARAFLAEVGRNAMTQRYVDELAHDINIVTQYRKAQSSGGQHVGTGGMLGAATPSTLVYLERLVADLRAVLKEPSDA